jgi:integrase
MFNAHYLITSRHNVIYFRWPIPSHFHPDNKRTDIKVSLDTRCPREGLQIARGLLYFASSALHSTAFQMMNYDQIRAHMKQHFVELRDKIKSRIASNGRLSPIEIEAFEKAKSYASHALDEREYTVFGGDDQLVPIIKAAGIITTEGTPHFEMVRTEYLKAYRDLCDTIIDHDKQFAGFDFNVATPISVANPKPKFLLSEQIEKWIEENSRLGNWSPNTSSGFRRQTDLLIEYLGSDSSLHVTHEKAQDVLDMLMRLPKRARASENIDKSLSGLLALNVPQANCMGTRTISKYVDTYIAFFDWAVKRRLTIENPFKSLRVKKPDGTREEFTKEQIEVMINELVTNKSGHIKKDYQKWGTLIAIYTGARLNEISQLSLSDVRQKDDIWCFDLNEEGSNKRLKNRSSKRLIPIHQDLINFGFLEYVDKLRSSQKDRVLYELSYQGKNGFGRNLGRWVNDQFLVRLGFKTKNLVLHSTRHTVLSYLLRADVEESVAKAISGHAPTGTLLKVYAHGYNVKQLQVAINRIYTDIEKPHMN